MLVAWLLVRLRTANYCRNILLACGWPLSSPGLNSCCPLLRTHWGNPWEWLLLLLLLINRSKVIAKWRWRSIRGGSNVLWHRLLAHTLLLAWLWLSLLWRSQSLHWYMIVCALSVSFLLLRLLLRTHCKEGCINYFETILDRDTPLLCENRAVALDSTGAWVNALIGEVVSLGSTSTKLRVDNITHLHSWVTHSSIRCSGCWLHLVSVLRSSKFSLASSCSSTVYIIVLLGVMVLWRLSGSGHCVLMLHTMLVLLQSLLRRQKVVSKILHWWASTLIVWLGYIFEAKVFRLHSFVRVFCALMRSHEVVLWTSHAL